MVFSGIAFSLLGFEAFHTPLITSYHVIKINQVNKKPLPIYRRGGFLKIPYFMMCPFFDSFALLTVLF